MGEHLWYYFKYSPYVPHHSQHILDIYHGWWKIVNVSMGESLIEKVNWYSKGKLRFQKWVYMNDK